MCQVILGGCNSFVRIPFASFFANGLPTNSLALSARQTSCRRTVWLFLPGKWVADDQFGSFCPANGLPTNSLALFARQTGCRRTVWHFLPGKRAADEQFGSFCPANGLPTESHRFVNFLKVDKSQRA